MLVNASYKNETFYFIKYIFPELKRIATRLRHRNSISMALVVVVVVFFPRSGARVDDTYIYSLSLSHNAPHIVCTSFSLSHHFWRSSLFIFTIASVHLAFVNPTIFFLLLCRFVFTVSLFAWLPHPIKYTRVFICVQMIIIITNDPNKSEKKFEWLKCFGGVTIKTDRIKCHHSKCKWQMIICNEQFRTTFSARTSEN